MERARATGEWVLRVYSWSDADDLARAEPDGARALRSRRASRSSGFGVVRRPTGGRAILHHREITYSVTAPVADAGDLRASYERINRFSLDGARVARRHGDRRRVRTTRAAPPGMAPCFDEPSAGELTVDGRKLAGSAQWRADGALLQHGSILVEDDQSLLAELALERRHAVPAPATLAEALGHAPSVERCRRSRSATADRGRRRSSAAESARLDDAIACPSLGSRRPIPGRCLDLAALMPRSAVVPTSARPASTHAHVDCLLLASAVALAACSVERQAARHPCRRRAAR